MTGTVVCRRARRPPRRSGTRHRNSRGRPASPGPASSGPASSGSASSGPEPLGSASRTARPAGRDADETIAGNIDGRSARNAETSRTTFVQRGISPWGRTRVDDADCGAVTAEFATVLPVVVALAVLLLTLTRVVVVQVACQDAASSAARAAVTASSAGVDPQKAAVTAAGQVGVVAAVSLSADTVTVTTSCPVVPDPMGVLPTKVTGKAVGVVSS